MMYAEWQHGHVSWDLASPTAQAPANTENPGAERMRRSILYALERLPSAQQLAIVLKDMHDLSYEDISSVTDQPVALVRSHHILARKNIAALM